VETVGALDVAAGGAAINTGVLRAQGDARLSAGGAFENANLIETGSNLALQGGSVRLAGRTEAAQARR
jgi:hypothetical protein